MGRPDTGIRRFETKPCEGCREDFTNSDPYYPQQRFCSKKCANQRHTSNPEHQAKAGRAGGRLRHREPPSPNTYLKVPGTDVHVHRAVAARELGRPLARGEVVHHEDENKHNNEPDNLIVFASQALHAKHHKLGHLGSPCDCPCIRLGGDAL